MADVIAIVADGIATFIFILFSWLMILPYVLVVDVKPLTNATYGVADVIATVADGIATAGWVCLWQMLMSVVDGETTKVNYLNFSSGVLNRTSSHTSGRWYLPIFLLRDGSLTLMYRAFLIVLIRFWSSLPSMLKLLMVTLLWC